MIALGAIIPAPGEKSVNLNSSISFTLVDDGTGIDITSLLITINGKLVLEDLNFKTGYDGPGSNIDPSGDNFEIIIDPTSALNINTVYSIDVKVKNIEGMYSSNSFSFKTISNEPFLLSSVPKKEDILYFPQVLNFVFADNFNSINQNSITISINGLNYVENGIFNPNFNGANSSILIPSGLNQAIVDIDPKEAIKNGIYKLAYTALNSIGKRTSGNFEFSVEKKEEVLPLIFPQTGFLGFFQGIKRVTDVGDGKSLLIEWNKPVRRTYQNKVYVLVYKDLYRLNVFDNPKYISTTDALEATITDLETGKALSYAARAMELPEGILDATGMETEDVLFKIPSPTSTTTTILPNDLFIPVESTVGYPNAGLVFVGSEVVRYNAVNRVDNILSVPIDGRGILNSIVTTHLPNSIVRLFFECTDRNTVILLGTPTYHDDMNSGRELNQIGVVVTDYSDNDREFFQRYDYCGWRFNRPQDTIYGKKDCNSYLGGEFNGLRGFNLYDRMLMQEEILLETSGEPVVLLKRIWDGLTCSCSNSRKVSPKVKSCNSCYGTNYEGGYIQYDYTRRNDGRILLSFKELQEKVQYGEKEGLMQAAEPQAWTLAQPTIRDRDLIIRFDFTNDIEYIYEVLNVTRSKNFNRKFGKQDISLKRLDKTDIVYTYPFNLSKINEPS